MVTMPTKKEYIETVRLRYRQTIDRKEKSQIIDEVVANLKKDRKHVIKILNGKYYRKKRRKHKTRSVKYPYELHVPLSQIWEVVNRPCSKNLKPQIPELIKKLKQFDEIKISQQEEILLSQMSTYTIDRLLKYGGHKKRGKGISGTKSSPLLKNLIPVRTNFDEVDEPGHLEQDCVLHCGESTAGIYAETLNVLDIETHWNEQISFLRKTKGKVVGGFHILKTRFPFPVKSIDFDNGSEFVNWAFKKYCDKNKIEYTRSRSYRKNDQAHIEERNGHRIRDVFGYDRITKQEMVNLMNDIYENEYRLLNNFFYATRKLVSKERVNKKVRKKYGEAKTPYQRVMESKKVDKKIKLELAQQYNQLNPAELKDNLHIKLKALKRLLSVSELNLATTPKN